MQQKAIISENLTKIFGDFTAVDHISFEVTKGEIFGFLGANGAGKTTAMRMFCGLSIPTSGNATVAGFDVYKNTEEIKKSIGYMSQKFSLYENLTILENLEFFGGIYGLSNKQIKEKSAELVAKLGLEKEKNKLVSELPLGWKQKLAFSVAIFHEPEIVFLDEPTGGVDPVTRRQFWDLIYEASENGITIFVTTHYMDEAEYCNRVSIMVDGKIEALDSPTNLKKQFNAKNMDEVILFGFALSNEIKNTGVAVFDQDKSVISSALISKIDANKYFDIDRNLTNPNQFQEAFKDGKVKIVLNQAKNSTQSYNVTPEIRMLYNPQLKGAPNFVPGVMALILLIVCVMMTAIAIVKEKETGTMEILLVSPMKPSFVIIAKAVPYFILSMNFDFHFCKNTTTSHADFVNCYHVANTNVERIYVPHRKYAHSVAKKEDADLILEIPSKFEKNIVRESQNKVLVAINAINGTKAGLSGMYLSQILQDYNKNILTELSPEIVEFQKNSGLEVVFSSWDFGIFSDFNWRNANCTQHRFRKRSRNNGTNQRFADKKTQFYLGKTHSFLDFSNDCFYFGIAGFSRIVYTCRKYANLGAEDDIA
ncbi:hypothetical protein Lal_00014637 [Lupinus albus]|nr:hypothetical protein Lal_00014637 [Lupinus albus]